VDPDVVVALTDYGLAVECAVFAGILWRGRRPLPYLDGRFAAFFGATALAALVGGTFHGFTPDDQRLPGALLWRVTLLAIGLAATAAWQVGAGLLLSPSMARWVSLAATLTFVGYAAVVIFVTQRFSIAIANYLPAALFLLGAFGVAYRRTEARPALLGMVGLGLSILSSGLQQAGIGLHPVYFNHNALYHLLQAVAFILIFLGALSLAPFGGGEVVSEPRGGVANLTRENRARS